MPYSELFALFTILLAFQLAPGPLMALIMTRAAGNDARGALGFGGGIVIGNLAVIAAVCLGLGVFLHASPEIYMTAKAAMIVYILWIAKGIWEGGCDMSGNPDAPRKGVMASVAAGTVTTVFSPHVIAIYLLLVPGLIDLTAIDPFKLGVVALVSCAAVVLAFGPMIAFAAKLRKLTQDPGHLQTINRVMAMMTAGVGGWMAIA